MNGAVEKIKSRSSAHKKMLLFLLLGPLALILTLAVAFTKPIVHPLFLTMAIVGFVISYQWGIKGFILSAVAVASLAFQLPTDLLWKILYSSSLILGFLITALSTEEARVLLVRMQSHSETTYEKMESLKAEAGKKETAYQEEISLLQEKLQEVERSVTAYEGIAKVAKHELHYAQLSSSKVSTEDKIDLPMELSAEYTQESKDQYKQLRKQFDEKTEILKQTRQQLFLTQNELLAVEKQAVEKQANEFEEFVLWQKLCSDLQKQQEYLRSQLADMENLVSQLMKKS